MKMMRLSLVGAASALAASALAIPPFVGVFNAAAKPPAGSALAKAACQTCHTATPPVFNPYGTDMKKALKESKASMVTAKVVKMLDKLDSDKDGVVNGVEIKAGTLPGDRKSKPATPRKPAPKPKKK